MGGINVGKVITGGLLAGLVINVGEYILNEMILAEQWAGVSERLGIPEPGIGLIVFFNVWGFVMGIAAVWLYAAIRPRYGAGAKTALCAGVCVWFFTWLMGFGPMAVMGIFPTGAIVTSLIWGLVEVPVGTVAGASLYKE